MTSNILGFYIVNGTIYTNKNHAFEAAIKSGDEIEFDFANDFWKKQQWTVPSNKPLSELYGLRAKQIREKHDHVALCLSGGADSLHVLKTFDINDIYLDEIVCWQNYSLTNNINSIVNGEIYQVAIPAAKEYISRHPTTVLTIVDQLDAFNEAMKLSDEKILQLMAYGPSPSSLSAFSGSWACTLPSFKRTIDTGRSFGLVWGSEKTTIRPILQENQIKYAFGGFNECIQAMLIKNTVTDYKVTDEFFFWAIDFPELMIKQCHVIKEFLDQIPLDYKDPYLDAFVGNQSKRSTHIVSKNGAKISLPILSSWLYGNELVNASSAIITGKPNGSMFLSPVDEWMKTAYTTTSGKRWLDVVTPYLKQYNKLAKISPNWKLNKFFGSELPTLATQPYFIE